MLRTNLILVCGLFLYLLSQVNPGLPGFLSFWVSPRALCWVLFSSSYILLTFPLSFQNIGLLVISLVTTFRHMFMVLLLVNFFSPAKLNYSQMSSQVKYRLLHGILEKIGEASADTAATETYYMKGYYNLEEETIKVNDLNSWMSSNRLFLNSAKTQLIWFGTPQQLLKLDHAFAF